MADQITQSTKCLNADSSPCHWEFTYDVVNGLVHNNFCVLVMADEMTDPTSEVEAKTKANVKASAIKAAWVASLADAKILTADITTPQDVTL